MKIQKQQHGSGTLSEPPDIVNTEELISDFTFLYQLSKLDSVLDFDVINPEILK